MLVLIYRSVYALRWKVYPGFIEPEDHLICKTYMTRVEVENTRLRHYLGEAYAPDRHPDGTGRSSVRVTSQNSLLLQISRNVELLYSSSTSLSQI